MPAPALQPQLHLPNHDHHYHHEHDHHHHHHQQQQQQQQLQQPQQLQWLVERFCWRMPAPSLEFMSDSMLTSSAVFCGSGSVVPSGFVFSSEVLPSFQPAFCSMLLRTVWFSTQS